MNAAISRDPVCLEAWPECEEGAYDPRCCRFPKSCSCTVYDEPTAAKRRDQFITVSEKDWRGLKSEVALHIAALDSLERILFGDVWRRSRDEMEARAEELVRGV